MLIDILFAWQLN